MTRFASITALLSGFALAAICCLTGCQVEQGGQVLPSAHTMKDDVQYFPTGAKFKLTQEAAAMKAYSEQQNNQQFAHAQTEPSINMLPSAQPADNSVTVSGE